MGQPGAKKNDQIVSATPGDVHIIMVPSPGGPVPTPIPHPCASIINDAVAEKVKVMGQPGAVKGSKSKHTPPHIPMGPGPFQKPPKNAGKIITGSANVFYEGKEAAMLGDTGEMCSDPSDTPVGKVMGTAATVLVGGGGAGSDEAREKASAAAMKAASAYCHAWVRANIPEGPHREQAHRDICSATGDPVDVATGKMMKRHIELHMNGRMPLQFAINYSSARASTGSLGIAWRHTFEIELIVAAEFVAMRDDNSRFIAFAPPEPGGSSRTSSGNMVLTRQNDGHVVTMGDGTAYHFAPESPSQPLPWRLPLQSIRDRWGNTIRLAYRPDGRLTAVRCGGSHALELAYDGRGLLTEVVQRVPKQSSESGRRVRFHYVPDRDLLVGVEDENGHVRRYEYSAHLLTREIDRNGDSFYYEYDAEGWCSRTWGDRGFLARHLEYDRVRGVTRVTDSLGYVRVYHWDERGVVTREEDHAGKVLRFDYDDAMRCVAEENGEGDRWTYAYDGEGRLIAIATPEAAVQSYQFDAEGRVVRRVGFLGGAFEIAHSEDGLIETETDPFGATTVEQRSHTGDLLAIRRADGSEATFAYDSDGNCVAMNTPMGLAIRRRFDARGDLVFEEDQFGRRLALEYDAAGYPIALRERDDREVRFTRDREGRAIRIEVGDHEVYQCSYAPFLGMLEQVAVSWRPDRSSPAELQCTRRYDYDTEGRLTRVSARPGTSAEIEYGEHGRARCVRYADGRVQEYVRDARGNVAELRENGQLVFRQDVNSQGRVVRREMADGEVLSFEYDAIGNLVSGSSTGESRPVSFERDVLGRVVQQHGDAGEFRFEYDKTGHCVGYEFADGLRIDFTTEYQSDGRSLRMAGRGGRSVSLRYDVRDRLSRVDYSSGETHTYQYAESDRLLAHLVRSPVASITERYAHDRLGRVARVERDSVEQARYERDGLARLVAYGETTASGFVHRRWHYDEAGNRTRELAGDGSIREFRFEAGNRPAVADGVRYVHDARGRVVAKQRGDGTQVRLEYDGHGRVRRVIRSDGESVVMHYDVLGRRVEARSARGTRHFAWVDEKLVHESRGEEFARHYLYQPGTHVPIAVLSPGELGDWQWHAITTDVRGAPWRVSDESGAELWRGSIGPWGERDPDPSDHRPALGLLGQYHDAETGLVHNGARIYDPESASYLTPDPVGLTGGLDQYGYVQDPVAFADPLGLNPEVIALGLQNAPVQVQVGNRTITGKKSGALNEFAKDPMGDGSVKAQTWTSFDRVEHPPGSGSTDLGRTIKGAMNDADEIHFNLEGMDNVDDILKNPDPSRFQPPSTNWELATVLSDPKLREKTKFYDEPGKPSKQIPCIK